jgi:hypothetical protein
MLCRKDPLSFRPKSPLLSSDRKTWGRSGEIYSKTEPVPLALRSPVVQSEVGSRACPERSRRVEGFLDSPPALVWAEPAVARRSK